MIRTIAGAAALVVSVLISAGCTAESSDKADSGPAGWPKGFEDFSIVWSGEKGIDLDTGPAVVVRAYVESFVLVELTGDQSYLYPGFSDAVGDDLRPDGTSPAERPWVGTEKNHLLSLARSGSDVTAVGCMYTYGAAEPDSEGRYVSRGYPPSGADAGIAAFKVSLTAPSESSGPGQPQTGPARTPFDDVFSGYRVTGYWGGYFSSDGSGWDWPERQQSLDECVAKAPDPLERRTFLTANFPPRNDFPTLPAAPGWPAKPAS